MVQYRYVPKRNISKGYRNFTIFDPGIAVERLFSRIPQEDGVFCNWGTSWWKLRDELLAYLEAQDSYQGKQYHYLYGAALPASYD